ncbi:hypothetical protein FGO68_gene3368 [Halteria grandinella]|uniref:Clu domain-containing protein n=1 Tax=Halteria grandinella TaxID=5974 RepID=A0A8J8P327_HALGN|nr:hypothetical protein FGO68_gene3368 [Halteria grandinella]
MAVKDSTKTLYEIQIDIKGEGLLSIQSTEAGFIFKDFENYSLVGLLKEVSPQFKRFYQHRIADISKDDPYRSLLASKEYVNKWICQWKGSQNLAPTLSFPTNREYISGNYGFQEMRDWNEEYQQCKELSQETQLQRIQRVRTLQRVYSEFVEAAKVGAAKIVQGNLEPLNPQDSQEHFIYIYNNIFFSHCLDSSLSYPESMNDTIPSFSAVNGDLKGLQQIENIDFKGLFTLATCLVKYVGRRLVCQSIIPGILSFASQESISEYGSSNNCKTIDCDSDFHKMMLQICSILSLRTVQVKDGLGVFKEIAGSPDIKGIRGNDRRKYLIDALRVHPRDANFPDPETHGSCIIRPEAIHLFKLKRIHKDREIYQLLKMPKDKSSYSFNSNFLTQIKTIQANNKDQLRIVKLANFVLNNLSQAFLMDILLSNESKPQDSGSLKQGMHSYGLNMRYLGHILSSLRKHCKQQELKCDYVESLLEKEIYERSLKHLIGKYLTQRNVQDAGQVLAHIFNSMFGPNQVKQYIENSQAQINEEFLERVKLRQILSYQNHISKEKSVEQQKYKCKQRHQDFQNTQPTNCCAATTDSECGTEYFCDQEISLSSNSTPRSSSPQNSIEKGQYFSPQLDNEVYKKLESKQQSKIELTPLMLQKELNEIAIARYGSPISINIEENLKILENVSDKLSIIRNVCKELGIKLEAKEYILDNNALFCIAEEPLYEWLPFQQENILDFNPTIKLVEHQNKETAMLMKKAEHEFSQDNFEKAFDLYAQVVSIYIQINGPLKREVFDCLARMSRIICLQGDIKFSISLQCKALHVCERLFGIDSIEYVQNLQILALYLLMNDKFSDALKLYQEVLNLLQLIQGSFSPDIAQVLMTLGQIFLSQDLLSEAEQFIVDAANMLEQISGRSTMEIASCLSNLAVIKFQQENIRDAVTLQDKAHIIISEIAAKQVEPKEKYIFHSYQQSSKELLDYYTTQCVFKEKAIKMSKQYASSRQYARTMAMRQRPIGEGGVGSMLPFNIIDLMNGRI